MSELDYDGQVFYGGVESTVLKQLNCEHSWHGPCIDDISRYFKCKHCFSVLRPMTEEQYFQAMKESYDTEKGI